MMYQQERGASPVERHAEPPVTSLRGWTMAGMFTLAIALPFVAGTMVWWPWPGPYGFMSSDWTLNTVLVAGALATIGGTFLVALSSRRAGWRLLLVPLAWMVGELLGEVVELLLRGGWLALHNEVHFWDTQGVLLPVALIPLMCCAMLGTGCGLAFSQWQSKRHQRT